MFNFIENCFSYFNENHLSLIRIPSCFHMDPFRIVFRPQPQRFRQLTFSIYFWINFDSFLVNLGIKRREGQNNFYHLVVHVYPYLGTVQNCKHTRSCIEFELGFSIFNTKTQTSAGKSFCISEVLLLMAKIGEKRDYYMEGL